MLRVGRSFVPTILSGFIFIVLYGCAPSTGEKAPPRYIEVSKVNNAYFSFSDGSTYVPVGINMINPSSRTHENPDSAFAEIDRWMKNLSENGGNYVRVWLSESFWDVEEEAGKYNEEKAKRIDRFIEMARRYKLRIKLTLEHFRSVTLEENRQTWANKFAYHRSRGGPLDSIRQYLTTEAGRKLFLNKIDFYQKRYGTDTLFFGWELWNEMNAMVGPEDSVFFAWNKRMLKEVKQRFPENLVMQSLGSFDGDYAVPVYKTMMSDIPGNEVAQVHRYLDLGARFEVCHGPMDIICSSAVNDLLAYRTSKPVMLAETGAVEPHHAGPSKLYPADTSGILLHDILFAPFFSGSAGTGMSWHWESYVDRNNLWFHFGRFSRAIGGIDPVKEKFIPRLIETERLRCYILHGRETTLLWLRDKRNNWQSELVDGVQPEMVHDERIEDDRIVAILKEAERIEAYDPWKDTFEKMQPDDALPDFKRSLVVRITNRPTLVK